MSEAIESNPSLSPVQHLLPAHSSERLLAETPRTTMMDSIRDWAHRRKLSLAVGASVLSLGVGVATNPTEKTLHEVEQQAAWVVPTEVGLDIGVGVGATMMLAATGTMVKNPLKAKKRLQELPQRANNSRLFKGGFALSAAAGIGWGAVATGSILSYLPPEAWGSLAFPVADLASTIVTRRMIWQGIRQSSEQPAEPVPLPQTH